MKKKITLKDIKVSTIATSLSEKELEMSQGGRYYVPGNSSGVYGGKEKWTEIKTSIPIAIGEHVG